MPGGLGVGSAVGRVLDVSTLEEGPVLEGGRGRAEVVTVEVTKGKTPQLNALLLPENTVLGWSLLDSNSNPPIGRGETWPFIPIWAKALPHSKKLPIRQSGVRLGLERKPARCTHNPANLPYGKLYTYLLFVKLGNRCKSQLVYILHFRHLTYFICILNILLQLEKFLVVLFSYLITSIVLK